MGRMQYFMKKKTVLGRQWIWQSLEVNWTHGISSSDSRRWVGMEYWESKRPERGDYEGIMEASRRSFLCLKRAGVGFWYPSARRFVVWSTLWRSKGESLASSFPVGKVGAPGWYKLPCSLLTWLLSRDFWAFLLWIMPCIDERRKRTIGFSPWHKNPLVLYWIHTKPTSY